MFRFARSLLFKVLAAILAGLTMGAFIPEILVRIMVTFNSIFSNVLLFSIPLIIIGLVTPAILSIGKGVGKLLFLTVAIAYGSTLFSGFFTYGVASSLFPSLLYSAGNADFNVVTADLVTPFFTINLPPLADVTSSLMISFIIGIGGTALSDHSSLKNFFFDLKIIIEKLIALVIIPLLPVYIFGLFLLLSFTGSAWPILMVFSKVIAVIFALHVVLLVLQFSIAGIVCRRNPLILLKNMFPAYLTALGTQSSAATIPVTLRQVIKNGVEENIAEFTVPLCATIHLSGSIMKIVACAVALMLMTEHPFSLPLMIHFIAMLGIIMVAAPGVPGGAIMAALGVLESILGFDPEQLALMTALYIAMDSFGTACNVTGDGFISLIVNKIYHALHPKT